MTLVSEVRCGSSEDEWDKFTIDSLDLTMDFANGEKLATNCNSSDLAFEFEVNWDDLLSTMLHNKSSTVWGNSDSTVSKSESKVNQSNNQPSNQLTTQPSTQTTIQQATEPSNEPPKQPINQSRKVLTITACTAAAVLAVVLVFTYGKGALITYLQSGTYNVQQHNRAYHDFQQLLELTLRND